MGLSGLVDYVDKVWAKAIFCSTGGKVITIILFTNLFSQKLLADAVNVAGTHGEDHITALAIKQKIGLRVVKILKILSFYALFE